MKKTTLLFAFILFLSYSAKSQDFDYSFMETYRLSNQANISVSSDNSNIEVIAHDGSEIQIFYLVQQGDRLLKSSKEEIEDLVSNQWEFDILETESSLAIRVLSTITQDYNESQDAIDVHFKMYVPKDIRTNLYSSDGDILLQGLTSNQKCISDDGDIKLVDLQGDITAQTMDGDIILKNVTGVLDSQTHDGRVIDLTNEKI